MPKIRTPIENAKANVDYYPAVGYRHWYVGVDIGTANDPTAFVVLEKEVIPEPRWRDGFRQQLLPPVYTVAQAFRLKLDLEYTEIVNTIERVYRAPEFEGDVDLAIDATGVGAPVSSMLRQRDLPFMQIQITSGDSAHKIKHDLHRVSKAYLMSHLNGAIENGVLRFADDLLDEAQLRRELEDFQTQVLPSGNLRFESSRKGHDDLVLALAIAYYHAACADENRVWTAPIKWQGG